MMNASSFRQQSAKPAKTGLNHNLDVNELIDFLEEVALGKDMIFSTPPVLPKEGELYVFDLGSDKSQWDQKKRKFR